MDRPGHQERVPASTSTTWSAKTYGGTHDRGRRPTSATPATRCSPARPAASSCTRRASSPGSASSSRTRPAPTTTSSRSRTSTRSTPGAVEGAGDLFGMFHDTPAAKSLMKYLVTAEAQDIWVKIGGALSANKNAKSYPDDISKRSADDPGQRQELRLRRVGQHADRDERRVLEGHGRADQRQQVGRPGAVRSGRARRRTRTRPSPIGWGSRGRGSPRTPATRQEAQWTHDWSPRSRSWWVFRPS